MPPSENGRVALVTGAGKRRVGNTVARMLAQRGYAIALHYHHAVRDAEQTVSELRSQGATAEAFAADVTAESQVQRLFQQVDDRFGRLDVLVTAAAVWEPKPLQQTTADDVRRQFEINALGTFLCCRHAGGIMAGQPEGGAIVTIGDWATVRPYPDYAAYFISKGSIPTMTRALAVELARHNPAVRVNCVLPGPVLLPPDTSEAERQQIVAGTLVKRLGRPEHVGQAVLFFVDNDFVTGVCLPVDGGRSIAGLESPI